MASWEKPFDAKWFGKKQPEPEATMKVTVNTQCSSCERKTGKRSIVVGKQHKGRFLETYTAAGAILNKTCRYCGKKLKMVQ